MRRILLALIAALAGIATLPAAANAGPQLVDSGSTPICLPRLGQATIGPPVRYWICFTIYLDVPVDPPIPDPCFCLPARH